MTNSIVRCGAILFVVLCPAIGLAQDLASVIEECEKSVVRIEVKGLDGDSLGSGFVISDDGLIVTNVHVLAGATKARAIFPSGNQHEIVGTFYIDEARDICVAKMTATSTKPIRLAEGLPRKGETVTALGAPLGLSFTATTGIVSAIRKDFANDVGDESAKGTWVQVDAALSPGNSGGPLINSSGEVVAMSTRASSGRAQNLNFGISIADIKAAIAEAKSSEMKPLSSGIQEVKSHDIAGSSKSDTMIRRKSVPESKITEYVDHGRETFTELTRNLRRDYAVANKELSALRKGKVGFPFGINSDRDIIIRQVRNTETYHFRSDQLKNELVDRQQKLVDKLKKLRKTAEKSPPEIALLQMLKSAGPAIDIREQHSVGFLSDATVIHSYNDHEVIGAVNGAPCLIWVESTAGLSIGQKVSPMIVYISGTETVAIPGKSTMSVTVLQEVSDATFDKVGAFSLWRAGKHKVEAKLLGVTDGVAELEKRNGKVVRVPLSKLDEASRSRAQTK